MGTRCGAWGHCPPGWTQNPPCVCPGSQTDPMPPPPQVGGQAEAPPRHSLPASAAPRSQPEKQLSRQLSTVHGPQAAAAGGTGFINKIHHCDDGPVESADIHGLLEGMNNAEGATGTLLSVPAGQRLREPRPRDIGPPAPPGTASALASLTAWLCSGGRPWLSEVPASVRMSRCPLHSSGVDPMAGGDRAGHELTLRR